MYNSVVAVEAVPTAELSLVLVALRIGKSCSPASARKAQQSSTCHETPSKATSFSGTPSFRCLCLRSALLTNRIIIGYNATSSHVSSFNVLSCPFQTPRSLMCILTLQPTNPRTTLPTLNRPPIPTIITKLSLRRSSSRRRRRKALTIRQRRRTEQSLKRCSTQWRRYRT